MNFEEREKGLNSFRISTWKATRTAETLVAISALHLCKAVISKGENFMEIEKIKMEVEKIKKAFDQTLDMYGFGKDLTCLSSEELKEIEMRTSALRYFLDWLYIYSNSAEEDYIKQMFDELYTWVEQAHAIRFYRAITGSK